MGSADVVRAFNLASGHMPEWAHDLDSSCLSLRCAASDCTFPVRPRITYRLAQEALRSGSGVVSAAIAEHLADFVEWHAEHQ